MPHYLIDTDDARTYVPGDPEIAFTCPRKAQAEAHRVLSGMAQDLMPSSEPQVLSAVVRDEAGGEIYTATLTVTGEWTTEAPA